MPIIKQEGYAIPTKQLRMTSNEEKALNEFLEKEPFKGYNWSESMRNLIQFTMKNYRKLSSHEPSETSNEKQVGDFFNCQKLCKKFDKCREEMNTSINILNEIDIANCYVTKFPYDWKTPDGRKVRVCKFMVFKRAFPHDIENPYPQCIAKAADRFVDIPKDHIMRDPQICWICVKLRKKARDQKTFNRATRGSKNAKVDWGNSGGDPDLWRLGDQ